VFVDGAVQKVVTDVAVISRACSTVLGHPQSLFTLPMMFIMNAFTVVIKAINAQEARCLQTVSFRVALCLLASPITVLLLDPVPRQTLLQGINTYQVTLVLACWLQQRTSSRRVAPMDHGVLPKTAYLGWHGRSYQQLGVSTCPVASFFAGEEPIHSGSRQQ
jgi:hypothetical protein